MINAGDVSYRRFKEKTRRLKNMDWTDEKIERLEIENQEMREVMEKIYEEAGSQDRSRSEGEKMSRAINIIFDGPPGPQAGKFIEVETDEGAGIKVGEWVERDDGLWALRIPSRSFEVENAKMQEALEKIYEEAGSHTVIAGQTGGFAKIFDLAKTALGRV